MTTQVPDGFGTSVVTSFQATETASSCFNQQGQQIDCNSSTVDPDTNSIAPSSLPISTTLPTQLTTTPTIRSSQPSLPTSFSFARSTTIDTSISSSQNISTYPEPTTSVIPQEISTSHGTSLPLGAIIGAAIGCAVIGAVLAGFICFFAFRKRNGSRKTPSSYVSLGSTARDLDAPEKYASIIRTTPMPMDELDIMSRQPDDATVRYKIGDLIEQIQSHVESFYHDDDIEITPALETELSRFETSQLSAPIATCFRSSNRPTVLIQHCIAFHIFNLTVAPGEGITPLIASELSGIVAANQYAVVSSSAPQGESSGSNVISRNILTSSAAAVKAYSQWKSLTSYLLPHLINDDGGPLPAEQLKTVSRIASHFSTVFEPWSNEVYPDAHRSRHLVKLVEQAIKTATWLFSQADCYKFEWSIPSGVMVNDRNSLDGQAIVVAPSMIKVVHGGEVLRNPQKMLDVTVQSA